MKKFAYLSLCFVAMVFCFAGCGIKPEELAKNNLSELHLNYFTAETQSFTISMWSGFRENPYVIDGVKQQSVEFCVLNVVPKSGVKAFGLGYTVEINEETFNGELEESPFDDSFGADLEMKVDDLDSIFVYVIVDGETEIGKMTCISNAFKINQTQALDIAVSHLESELLDLCDNGNLSIEGYCKIISTDKNLGVYFWYINFVNSNGVQIAVVIDTTSGEIVAQK
ncbi:MAG: PepSY domain-containing protein [Clostridia bacterium]|nr:PepSY domain-containing protein [Clostridia bacterium]